jgi:hypothetical protein
MTAMAMRSIRATLTILALVHLVLQTAHQGCASAIER